MVVVSRRCTNGARTAVVNTRRWTARDPAAAPARRSRRRKGLIIPVVLRGFAQLPERIQRSRQAIDFSHFTLATQEMSRNPHFVARIEEIAKQIHEHFDAFSAAGDDPCEECQAFTLPPEGEVAPWRPPPVADQPAWQPAFPNR